MSNKIKLQPDKAIINEEGILVIPIKKPVEEWEEFYCDGPKCTNFVRRIKRKSWSIGKKKRVCSNRCAGRIALKIALSGN